MQANQHTQRGATFLGGLIIASILGMALYVVIRLYPLYWEYFEVVRSVESVAKEGGTSVQDIRGSLAKKWVAGYVETLKPEDITVTKSGDGFELTIDYRAERPFIGNVSLVVDFYKSVKVQ